MSAGSHEDYFGGGGGGGGPSDAGGRFGGMSSPSHGGSGDVAQQPQTQQKYRFNQEEMRAIRECNRESFYYRCLPIGTGLGLAAYYGVRYGYLKPSARFGAGPKMFAASVLGYFLGKFSYQSVCAEKLMALPNSQLGELLRKQKGRMGLQETLSMEPGFATAAPVGAPAFSNSDLAQSHSHSYSDVGDTQPMSGFDNASSGFSGYDANQQQSTYDTTQQMLDDENLPIKRPQFATGYDDLRRQNRIDYETRQHTSPASTQQSNPSAGGGYDGLQSRRSQPTYPPHEAPGKPRNKYGDVWDDKPSNY